MRRRWLTLGHREGRIRIHRWSEKEFRVLRAGPLQLGKLRLEEAS